MKKMRSGRGNWVRGTATSSTSVLLMYEALCAIRRGIFFAVAFHYRGPVERRTRVPRGFGASGAERVEERPAGRSSSGSRSPIHYEAFATIIHRLEARLRSPSTNITSPQWFNQRTSATR
jgi:hypothetical protein